MDAPNGVAPEHTKWIFLPKGAALDHSAPPKLRLFCFPQAGSGAWVYQDWQRAVPPGVQVLPVELPGNGSRMKDAKAGSMSALVDALLAAIAPLLEGPPFALLGHSLGAWVAFAAAQELQRRGGLQPLRLYVSGVRSAILAGPENDPDRLQMHRLEAPEFWMAMGQRYGRNPDLEDPAVRKFVYPLLQADFKIGETWRPVSTAPPLPCPIVATGGMTDPRCPLPQLEAWRQCSSFEEQFRLQRFPGGHSYMFKEAESRDAFMAFLTADLQGVVDGLGGKAGAAGASVDAQHPVRPKTDTDGSAELPVSVPAGSAWSVHSSNSWQTAATVGSTGSGAVGGGGAKSVPPSAAAMQRAARRTASSNGSGHGVGEVKAGEGESPKWLGPPGASRKSWFECVLCPWKT